MSLTKAAAASHEDAVAKQHDSNEQRYENVIKSARASWEKEWYRYPHGAKVLIEGLEELPRIESEEILTKPNEYPFRMRVISDGVAFLYTSEHQNGGWYVERTCPSCENKVGVRWYGLADLGEQIAAEQKRAPLSSAKHTCYESAARRVARELRYESQRLGVSPGDLVGLALDALARMPR